MNVDYISNLCYNYTYDSIGRLIRQKASTRSGDGGSNDRIYATEYGYDALNNVTKMANTAGGRTQKVIYDYIGVVDDAIIPMFILLFCEGIEMVNG